MTEHDHAACLANTAKSFEEMFGYSVQVGTEPDHECRWWKCHSCEYGEPVWVHPTADTVNLMALMAARLNQSSLN